MADSLRQTTIFEGAGKTAVAIFRDSARPDRHAGSARTDAKDAVRQLTAMGVTSVILSAMVRARLRIQKLSLHPRPVQLAKPTCAVHHQFAKSLSRWGLGHRKWQDVLV